MDNCPHHGRFEKQHEQHYTDHRDHEHRLSVVETLAATMADTISDIRTTVNNYGLGMLITLVCGFVGLIVTVWLK